MDARATCQTFWDTNNHSENLEEKLNEKGVFDTIECLFPAKVNHFLEKRLQSKKTDVENDSIKFLKKDKNRNISKHQKCVGFKGIQRLICICRYSHFAADQAIRVF